MKHLKADYVLAKPRLIAVADVVTLYDPAGRAPDWATVVVATVYERMFKDYDFDAEQLRRR